MAGNAYFYGRKGKLRQEHINYINALSSSEITPVIQRLIDNMFDTRPRTQSTIDYHFGLLQRKVNGENYNPFWGDK